MPSGPAMLTPSIAALLLPLLAGAAPPHARLTATLDPLNVSGNTVFRRPCVSPTLRPGGEAQAAANTAAVQHSVDSCGAAGGGVVELPTGDYVVGCIQLRSKIELRFGSTYAQRARLVASSNASLYSSSCDAVLYSSSASSGTALTSVAVTGHGAVDGTIAADKLRPLGHKLSTGGSVLFKLAHLCNISTLHLQGVSFLSSPSWHVHLEDCSDVSVTDVTIAGPTGRSETDGLDLDNCRRVHVARVDIGTGDDAIAIKSSAGGVTEDVLIEDTTLRSKELAFGSSASCRNITVRRSAVGWGIYIKLHRDEVKAPGRSVVSHSILIEDVFTWEVPYPHFNDTYQPCAIAINLDYPCPFNIVCRRQCAARCQMHRRAIHHHFAACCILHVNVTEGHLTSLSNPAACRVLHSPSTLTCQTTAQTLPWRQCRHTPRRAPGT
jgi:hypothetical protein